MKISNIYKNKNPILPLSLNDTDSKINIKYSSNIQNILKYDKFNKQLVLMEEGKLKSSYADKIFLFNSQSYS